MTLHDFFFYMKMPLLNDKVRMYNKNMMIMHLNGEFLMRKGDINVKVNQHVTTCRERH